MPTYIIGNWTDQGVRNVKEASRRLDAAKKMIKDAGGEMKAFYMTMGAYDLVTRRSRRSCSPSAVSVT